MVSFIPTKIANFFSVSAPGAVAQASQTAKELPKEIIANGQWVVADMDGTLIGAPGYRKALTLDDSVAKDAIFNWLRVGGQLLVLTGAETQKTLNKFARFIPGDLKNALIERRLLLGTNGGATISYFDGSRWTEDCNFQNSAIEGRIAITKENEVALLANAVTVINEFYREVRENESFVPENLKAKCKNIIEIASEHHSDFTLEELETLDSNIVPRIEVRRCQSGEIVQMCIIGIYVDLNYDISKLGLDLMENLELGKVNYTHEINIKGVDKALAVRWLQEGQPGYPAFRKELSVGIGDRPNHNDLPLTTAVGSFVSVCENNSSSYIPEHVTLKIGHNEAGTKQLLEGLLNKAHEFNKVKKLEPVIVNTLGEVVQDSINSFP